MRRLAGWTLVLACALSGCVSARAPRYYTISIPRAAAVSNETQIPVTLVVGRLYAPHLLRDDRVVYGLSDVEMGVDDYHRWAEPPTGMIERLLVQHLRASGRFQAVQHLSSTTRGDFVLRGYLGALNEVDEPGGLKARTPWSSPCKKAWTPESSSLPPAWPGSSLRKPRTEEIEVYSLRSPG